MPSSEKTELNSINPQLQPGQQNLTDFKRRRHIINIYIQTEMVPKKGLYFRLTDLQELFIAYSASIDYDTPYFNLLFI